MLLADLGVIRIEILVVMLIVVIVIAYDVCLSNWCLSGVLLGGCEPGWREYKEIIKKLLSSKLLKLIKRMKLF